MKKYRRARLHGMTFHDPRWQETTRQEELIELLLYIGLSVALAVGYTSCNHDGWDRHELTESKSVGTHQGRQTDESH